MMASNLRHRTKPLDDVNSDSGDDASSASETEREHVPKVRAPVRRRDKDEVEGKGISVLDVFRVLFVLILANCALSYFVTSESFIWGYKRPWFTKVPDLVRYIHGPVVLTVDELSLYNGSDPSRPLYLSVNGTIYDVSTNPHTYGPGGSYHFFTGRDATRAFVSGCFKDDLTSDLRGLEEMFMPIEDVDDEEERSMTRMEKQERANRELAEAREKVKKTVQKWQKFFADHEKYFEVGKVAPEDLRKQKKGHLKPLCDDAKKMRPKRSTLKKRARDQEERLARERGSA